jgi:hypothetical protein
MRKCSMRVSSRMVDFTFNMQFSSHNSDKKAVICGYQLKA